MTSYILAFVFFIAASLATGVLSRSEEFMITVVLATLVGYLLGRVSYLGKDLKQLRQALARDWEERNQQVGKVATETRESVAATAQQSGQQVSDSSPKPEMAEGKTAAEPVQTKSPDIQGQSIPPTPGIVDKATELVKGYFTGGNLFVRVGILLLFFGVSFLIKYVSDKGMLPIEYRLMGVAVAAIALLIFGWRLRTRKPQYALLLQGAGIGILYLDIFGAFSIYHLLPALAAFVLLFVVSMLATALAVLQDSRALAVLGFSGGFLAPVLASSNSGNHVGLFSYYAILNAALVAVAWFKAWRPLNLLGFAFTFVIGAIWGFFDYKPEKFATTEPFLLLFFLFYVLIAVLFALRQPPKLRGYVDGTLLFGVPMAASALQYALVKEFEYGVALSAFGFGAFYLLLALMIWKKAGQGLRLLSEAFLAVGVIFTSLAIPFALDPVHTAAAWGLEGLGLIWLGTRQNRFSVRLFGLLLQAGAGVLVLWRHDYLHTTAFLNSSFISAMMMAIAGIISARLLYKSFDGKKEWESTLSPLLLAWGLLWLFGGFFQQGHEYLPSRYLEHFMLAIATAVSLVFTLTAMRTKPAWQHAWYVAMSLFPAMLLALLAIVDRPLIEQPHPLFAYGWLVWPIAFAAFYWLLRKLDDHNVEHPVISWLHISALLLVVLIVGFEGHWQIQHALELDQGWQFLWWCVPVIAALWTILKLKVWPFSLHTDAYQYKAGLTLAGLLAAWGVFATLARGDADPLPWLPLLNPSDLMLGFVLVTLFLWWQGFGKLRDMPPNSSRTIAIAIAGLCFLWLNFTVFRIAYHWFGVEYTPQDLFNSGLVQTSISVLWALIGVVLTVVASRHGMRQVWIAGGILLSIVVLKLFVVDLSELSGGGRIVSFLIVGTLLTSIGYFAPLPGDNEMPGKENEKNA